MTAQYLTYVGVPGSLRVRRGGVHSAGSGVGRMVTQLAARRGGRVIATVVAGRIRRRRPGRPVAWAGAGAR